MKLMISELYSHYIPIYFTLFLFEKHSTLLSGTDPGGGLRRLGTPWTQKKKKNLVSKSPPPPPNQKKTWAPPYFVAQAPPPKIMNHPTDPSWPAQSSCKY